MKNILNYILILSLVFSNAVLAADKSCQTPLTGLDPYKIVHVKKDGLIVGLYQCNSCDGLRRPVPDPKSPDDRVVCEGCGNPFDSSEPTIAPVFVDKGDDQTYTEARFLPRNDKEEALFRKAGKNWACASCHSQNWSYNAKCTGCAAPREGNEDPNFNPFAESKVSAVKGREGVVRKDSGQDVRESRSRDTRDNSGSFAKRDGSGMSDRTKKIILSATLAAILAIGLSWYLAYNYTHPDPLTGEVTDIVKEFVIFKDEATYNQYKKSVLDLAHLPAGIQVATENDITLEKYNGPVKTSAGYIVQMTYANVVVGGYHFTLALDPEEAASWKKGDPVVLEFDGPNDIRAKKVVGQ